MAATLLLPPLSRTLQFPCSSTKIPKLILSSKPQAANLTQSSDQSTTNDGKSTDSQIDEDSSLSFSPLGDSNSVVKVPTAPWMKGPLLAERSQVLDFSKARVKKGSTFGKNVNPDKVLTGKAGAGRGKKEMKKIFQGIKKLQENRSSEDTHESPEKIRYKFLPGELWGDGSSQFDEAENKLVDTQSRKNVEEIEFDFSLEEVEGGRKSKFGRKMPWDVHKRLVLGRVKKEKRVTAAELSLDKELLQRLRVEAAKIREWVKVKKAGVTQTVVDQVFLIWKKNELAMLKFDLPLSQNMDRAREIIEMKTGGLVVWRKKDALVVYKGYDCQKIIGTSSKFHKFIGGDQFSTFRDGCQDSITVSEVPPTQPRIAETMTATDIKGENLPLDGSLYEKETDRLLDGLGPRFVDWWFPKPLPVDGDLLPEVIPGFKPPFRLCPAHSRSKLMNDELAYLRKLALSLPTHFVLGRNRKLQGLAVAILKLWEKCHIAKIAIKWGIPNTDNKQMADELKCLTGGVLLLRNKFIIILYRGKDFLPPQVAELVVERELELTRCQLWEEAARLRGIESFSLNDISSVKRSNIGSLSEYQNIESECVNLRTGKSIEEVKLEAEKEKLEKELRNQQRKLFILRKKIEKAAKTLAELNSSWRPAEHDADQEMMTEEEKECLRKMGLKLEATLVLGRRGVFDGVIESLHQHWKHREIVKVITKQRKFSQVIYTAKFLEAESKGILVSIEKLKEGHAIILYRGKNHKRSKSAAINLLNKRDALSRSIAVQRIGSLKFFANQSEQTISDLKSQLAELMQKRIKLAEGCLN